MSDTRVAVRPYVIGPSATSFVVPAAVTGLTLQAHWDASISASVIESGGLVSQWIDQSVFGRNITQSTGANKPTYPGNPQNSLNTMLFGDAFGVTFLDNASFVISQPFVIFMGVYNSNAAGALLIDDTTGTNRIIVTGDNGSGRVAVGAGTNITGTSDTRVAFHIVTGYVNGASSEIFVDSTSETTGDAGALNFSTFRLGARFDGTTLPYVGLVGEVKIYSGTPGVGEIASIITTLRSKWGV